MFPVLLPVFARFDVTFDHGEGVWLTDRDGKRYLDFASGIAVNCLGHAHPRLVAALTEQAGKLWHCSNLYRVPGQERVAARLVEQSFADTVFFCNSGAEAIECALKTARKYHDDTGNPDRWRVVVCDGAFHGRTLFTIAAGAEEKYRVGFGPTVPGFDRVPFGDLAATAAAITAETGAILVEPVQGEGGIFPAPPGYLAGLRALADQHGLLLIFDEVQAGMGRTGTLFAHQADGVTPDLMALAKGLGGGFPVGACLATQKAAVGMGPGTHGSTFGGNPLAMAVAEAVLEVMTAPGFFESMAEVSDHLRQGLEQVAARYPSLLQEVRGRGLMLGIKMGPPVRDVVGALLRAGLLAVPAGGNVIRLLPSLILSKAEADQAVAILDGVLAAWA